MKNSYSTQLLQATETKEKVDALKSDNKELEDKITALGQVREKPPIWLEQRLKQMKRLQEMKFLKDVFIAHASNSSNGAASSTSTTVVSGRYRDSGWELKGCHYERYTRRLWSSEIKVWTLSIAPVATLPVPCIYRLQRGTFPKIV